MTETEQQGEIWCYRSEAKCARCGCELSNYEIFAARLRGLRPPVCLGCLIDAIIDIRERVWPLLVVRKGLLARA